MQSGIIYYRGQTFVEVVLIVSLTIVVMTALISGSIASMKISQHNTLKTQAVKYAYEGIELARKERDFSWSSLLDKSRPSPRIWCVDDAHVWSVQVSSCPVNIANIFSRSIRLSYDGTNELIRVLVTISWRDGAEVRTSKVETFFTRWR